MSAFSPSAAGWRLVFRRPAIPLAEIAWRWSVAAAFWFLLALLLLEYADTLPVRKLDRFLLGTQQPVLAWIAARRIFSGSALRLADSWFLLAIAMTAAWIVVASVGRSVTLKAIMRELGVGADWDVLPQHIFSIAGLNFLRALVTFTALMAVVGAFLAVSGISVSTHMPGTSAGHLWIALVWLLGMAWLLLNWILSTAAVFVVKDSVGMFEAIGATMNWWGEKLGAVLAAASWFGVAHTGAFIAAYGAFFILLGVGRVLGPGPAVLGIVLVIAVYCAVADFLYIGRMAAYVSMFRSEPEQLASASVILPSDQGPAAIDASELILSDVPLPAS
jgi:hypothetical protein